jgi:excisionase family DNA binding protein
MGRPPLKHDAPAGLTTTEVARQLGCSPSYVRKLLRQGYFPVLRDGAGSYRFHPRDVAEVAHKLGRVVKTDGQRAARIYRFFLEPGFKPTRQAIARIVIETSEHPDVVLAFWEKFQAGVGTEVDPSRREIERLEREYDEQIAVMDEELRRRRRSAPPSPGDAVDCEESQRSRTGA